MCWRELFRVTVTFILFLVLLVLAKDSVITLTARCVENLIDFLLIAPIKSALENVVPVATTIKHPLFKAEMCSLILYNVSYALLIRDTKQENVAVFGLEPTTQEVMFSLYNSTWDGCNCDSKKYINECEGILKLTVCKPPPYNDKFNITWIGKFKLATSKVQREFYFYSNEEEETGIENIQGVADQINKDHCELKE